MPQRRGLGQRYFEEQPSEDYSPHKKRTQFHRVFGNKKVRTFQKGGPNPNSTFNRGRRNSRGQGRGQRGNSSTSGRRPDAPADTPDWRSAGNDFDTNARTPQVSFTTGKRPAFQQRDSDGKRRKRYVPGGLIPKFKRIEEYGGETYCDVCDEGFRDVNAKALHDRSKKHRLNYGYLRAENKTKDDEHMLDIAGPIQQSEEDLRKQFEEGTDAFLSINFNKLPKPFEEWVSRSLVEGKKAAVESKDPSILQAIQREIVDVYRVNDANCTLRRVCWDRRELASGSNYRLTQTTTSQGLPIIQDSKIHIKAAHPSKKEDEKPKPKKPCPKRSNRPSPREVVVEEVEEENEVHDISQNAVHPPKEPSSSVPAHREGLPYHEKPLTWRPSRDAEVLLSCCQTGNRESVLRKYYGVFGSGRTRSADDEQEELERNESLMTTYRELRRQYESEDYEYDDLMSSLSTLAEQFEKTGKHIKQRRHIFQMQIHAALQGGEFCECVEPCSKYVGTFSKQSHVRGRSIGLVGHWLISLLFKNKTGAGRKGFPAILQVAQEMRKLPIGAAEDVGVYEAIQAVKGVLGNNWCQFFGRSLPSIVHCQGPTFKQILEGLFSFMRERALVVMTHTNVLFMRSARMTERQDIRAEDARKLLGWENEDVEESIADMKDFVASLPQRFEFVCKGDSKGKSDCESNGKDEGVGKDENNGKGEGNGKDVGYVKDKGTGEDEDSGKDEGDESYWIRLEGKVEDEDLTLSQDGDVRVEMLAKWSKPVVLDEDY